MHSLAEIFLAPLLPLIVGALLGRYGRTNRLRYIERPAEVAEKFRAEDRPRADVLAQAGDEVRRELDRLRTASPVWLVAAGWLATLFLLVSIATGIVLDGPTIAAEAGQEVTQLRQSQGLSTASALVLIGIRRLTGLVFYVAFGLVAWRAGDALLSDARPAIERLDVPGQDVGDSPRWWLT